MANKNDEKIITLKQQINEKKSKLKEVGRFTPITNCNLVLQNERYNLNVLWDTDLTTLLIQLNMYKMSAENLGLNLSEVYFSGYPLADWMTDISGRLTHLNTQRDEKALKALEDRLTQLLSEEKRTELELEAIEKGLM